jgi:hypothetical protein
MCCGSKRSALRNASTPTRASSSVPPTAGRVFHGTGAHAQSREAAIAAMSAGASPNAIVLCHKEPSPVRARGPVTGRLYDFSRVQPALLVESRDAAVMIRSGLFYRP